MKRESLVSEKALPDAKAESKRRKKAVARLNAFAMQLDIDVNEYSSNVYEGDSLEKLVSSVENFKERACLKALDAFIAAHEDQDSVAALYGVRRTGKTTMMLQEIAAMPEEKRAQCVYMLADDADDVTSVEMDIQILAKKGKRFFFIDEATEISDFISSSNLFADIDARAGRVVVLSGTDSLKIDIAARGKLLDRVKMIHTTRMLFSEWTKITEKNINDHIHYGGLLAAKGYEPDAQFTD